MKTRLANSASHGWDRLSSLHGAWKRATRLELIVFMVILAG